MCAQMTAGEHTALMIVDASSQPVMESGNFNAPFYCLYPSFYSCRGHVYVI